MYGICSRLSGIISLFSGGSICSALIKVLLHTLHRKALVYTTLPSLQFSTLSVFLYEFFSLSSPIRCLLGFEGIESAVPRFRIWGYIPPFCHSAISVIKGQPLTFTCYPIQRSMAYWKKKLFKCAYSYNNV